MLVRPRTDKRKSVGEREGTKSVCICTKWNVHAQREDKITYIAVKNLPWPMQLSAGPAFLSPPARVALR